MHKFCEAQLQSVNESKLKDKRQALTKLMAQVTQPMTLGSVHKICAGAGKVRVRRG